MPENNISICVYCGASENVDSAHIDLAISVGECIAKNNCRLVYGGGSTGLMGACARATHESGGQVFGVITGFLRDQEVLFDKIPHEIVVTMRQRKDRLMEESDAFIVLPGGVGTLEEMSEVLSWLRLNILDKPIVLLDPTDFWDPITELLNRMVDTGFAPEFTRTLLPKASTSDDAVRYLINNIK